MDFNEELMRGSIVPIVLSLLRGGEMYGYEMVKAVNARTNGALAWKEGTLYPALHRLEAQGLVKSHWKTANSGKDRKYYALTRKGQGELVRRTSEWQQFSAVVNTLLMTSQS